jgi:hypothetical protein
MSDLNMLDNIRLRNGDIKAFVLQSNLISANTGKNNWGNIKIAVYNATIYSLFQDDIVGVLYITTKREWEAEKEAEKNTIEK